MKNKFLIILAASLLFLSCANDVQSPDSENNNNQVNPVTPQTPDSTDEPVKYVSIQGTFNLKGAIPSEILNLNQNNNFQSDDARTAMPSLPNGWKYYVIAKATGHITKSYDFTVGVSNQNGDFTINGNTYLLKNLASSKLGIIWTVEFGIKKGDTVIMSDSNPFKLTEEVPVYVHDFLLKPETGGTGTVSLEMKVPSTVKQVTSNNSKFNCSAPDTNGKVIVSGASVNTGCYTVNFEFWDKAAGAQDENKKLRLYSDTQVINVLKGCETKTWISNGGTDVVKNGVYEVTASHLDTFKRTTFYIGPTAFCTTASDLNNGSPADPVLSLNRVALIIANQNISNRTYTIYISTDIEGPQSLTDALDGKAQKIIISGNEVQSTGYPKFNLKGLQTGSSLTVGTSVEVELKDLIITNGKAENGGGINITKGTVSADNVRINFNEATASGGGVYIAAGASFTMKGTSVMSSNSVSTGGTGSGVYVAASNSTTASFTISDTAKVSNDVFLAQNGNYIATINVTGLSTDAASTVATITPENAKRNLAVLSGTNISNLYSKFQTSYDADSFAINNEGKLVLAKILTTIYVGNTTVGTTNYTAANPSGNTKDDSTWKHFNSNVNYSQRHPFTTIEKALQFITWQDSKQEYIITVSGTISGANTIANNNDEDNPITLTKDSNIIKLSLTGTNSGTLDGGFSATAGNGTTLTINTAVPITITNLTIQNGYQAQGNGGGICISNANADVTISTNTTIKNCNANKGGAIYNLGTLTFNASIQYGYALVYNGTAMGGGIYNEKTLNMTGGDIRYCKAGPETTDTVGDGAGVYLTGANAVFNMSGGYIGNGGVAKGKGGGVYVGAGSKIFMSGSAKIGLNNPSDTATAGNRYNEADKGGGLYVEGEAYIGYTAVNTPDNDFSGSVKYNYAHNYGGGIYIYKSSASAGKVVMLKGAISYNGCGTTNDTAYGGGIYLSGQGGNYKSTFEMLGGEMTNNKAYKKGGAVYAGYGTFDMQSGTLSSNSVRGTAADCVGGAIYIPASGGEFKIKGGATIPNGAAKNNDIYLDRYQSGGSGYNNYVHINGSLSGTDKVATLSIANNITKAFDKTDNASDTEFRAGPKRFKILSTTGNAAAADGSLYKTTFVDELLKSQDEVVLDITGKDYKLEPPTGDDSYTSYGGHGANRDQCLIVPSGKTLKLTATSLTEISPSVLCGCFIEVSSGGTLIIEDNVKITPGDSSIWAHAITCYGTVKMQGGSISGFNCLGSNGVVYVQSGTNPGFEMTGGVIENNGPRGAVLVWTGTFNMSGGIIRNNSNNQENHAGGITVGGDYAATLIKSGGTVSGNTSDTSLTEKANNIYITGNSGYYGTSEENVQHYPDPVIDPWGSD